MKPYSFHPLLHKEEEDVKQKCFTRVFRFTKDFEKFFMAYKKAYKNGINTLR